MTLRSLFSSSFSTTCCCGLALGVLLAGCSGSSQAKVYPVSGKVTFDGKPMEGGGSIAFVPTGAAAGKAPGGLIDPQGNYTLGTYAENDGSMPGDFRVVIRQVTVNEPTATPDGSAPIKAAPGLPREKHIPAIYSDFKNSPATAKVGAKPNQIDIDLRKQ